MPAGTFKNPHLDGHAQAGRRGFALLITVTLLAFLVLLLVSLAALTRVETQVAGNSQQIAQARQNALMALNIAIGQLQKAAGPDQRVTATADLAGGSGGVRLQIAPTTNSASTAPDGTMGNKKYWDATNTDNGLGKVVAGTRYWTGVWGNYDPAAPTAGNGNIYEKTPRPVLLNWLVSGNEGAEFASSTAAATFGQIITQGTSIAYTPTGTATTTTAVVKPSSGTFGATATATTALTFGGVATKPVVLLVGAKAAGTEDRTLESKELAADRYVVAPLVTINAPMGTVPGLGAAVAPPIGRYAYWVGDEGVKARINLADRYATSTAPATDPLARARLLTAPRSGAEIVADTPVSGTFTDFANTSYLTWSTTDASAKSVMSLSQLGFLDGTNLSATVLGRHFNDFTTSSVGVEADAYNGGLRRDLTYYFEQGTLPTWTGPDGVSNGAGTSHGLIPAAYSPTMGTLDTSDKRVPRWDVVRSFYNLPSTTGNSLTGGSGDTVRVQVATDTQMGITPVIVQMRLLVGVIGNSNATPTSDVPSVPAKTLRILVNPLVELANPYTVNLSAPNGINFQFKDDTRIDGGNSYKFGDSGTQKGLFSSDGVLSGTILHIPAFTLHPGQAAVFYVQGANAVAASGVTVTLVQMSGTPPNAGGTFTDYIYRDYGSWAPGGTSVQIRPWETGGNSTALAEFTLQGSTQILQQLGGINPNRDPSQYHAITIDPTNPSVQPVFVYAWQYNEPGDSSPYSGAALGMGNTALRPWTDFNPRGGYFRVTNYSYGAAPYVQFYMPFSQELLDFSSGLVNLYWGRALPTNGTVANSILFDIPRRNTMLMNDLPVISLGSLQHANLTAEDIPSASSDIAWEFGSTSPLPPNPGHQPAYAFGNSYASIFLPRAKAKFLPDATNYPYQMDNWGSNLTAESSGKGTTANGQVARNYYDISYLLNTALWDGYFFSAIPQSGDAFAPVNPRLGLSDASTATATNVRNGQQAAAYTLIDGAFNINSTSVDAWVAVLGGMKNLPRLPNLASSEPSPNTNTVFPRSIRQPTQAIATPTGTGADSYSGYRQLTDANIQTLATAIVKQVRMRGPFVSLSHFVNRVLVAAGSDTTSGLGQSGALQTAIDTANLNVFSDSTASASADRVALLTPTDSDQAAMKEAGVRGTFSLFADGSINTPVPTPLQRSAGIPGWLTQADLLQAIGPVISTRSDTFVIRAYGETNNPVLNPTTPVAGARAWCEAVVQRMPDYVDQTDFNLTGFGNATAPAGTNATNQTYGRRFKIVSFRWLSPNDI